MLRRSLLASVLPTIVLAAASGEHRHGSLRVDGGTSSTTQKAHSNQTVLSKWRQGKARRQDKSERRLLFVDVTGPNRLRGDGVRLMGMVRDMQACGYSVEVLSETRSYEELRQSWPQRVQDNYLAHTRLWSQEAYKHEVNLADYSRIIIGGKLDLMDPGRTKGVVQTVIADILADKDVLRGRTSAFWDDVPFERCEYRNLCGQVPSVVSTFAQAAQEFYVLTEEDASLMRSRMKDHSMRTVTMSVWPMRIADLAELLPSQNFDAQGVISSTMTQLLLTPGHTKVEKKYITMIANNHAVNRQNLGKLFKNDGMAKVCEAVRSRRSPVKFLFLGAIASEARTLLKSADRAMDCIEIIDKFVPEDELRTSILPNTRAVLNPFFFDVRSGISVKTYEAIMGGYPFITSKYGLHGLWNIAGCNFQTPHDPQNLQDFAEFLVSNVVDDNGYRRFIRQFGPVSKTCMQRQMEAYPLEQICH